MNDLKKNPKMILGDVSEPYTLWLANGRLFGLAGLAMLGGVEAMGLTIAKTTSLVAGGVIIAGIIMMAIGTTLKKNLAMALQAHEIKMRRSKRERPEPSNLDNQFFAWFSTLPMPVTRRYLVDHPFPPDLERDHADLAASSTVRRADFWHEYGKIKRIGDTYDLRDRTDSTVFKEAP